MSINACNKRPINIPFPTTEGVQQDSSSTTSPPEGPVAPTPSDVAPTDSSSVLPALTTHTASLLSTVGVTAQTEFQPTHQSPHSDAVPSDVTHAEEEADLPSEVNTPTPASTDPPTTDPATANACPELQCLDGTCISVSQLNDGVNDCPSGTDEQDFGDIFP